MTVLIGDSRSIIYQCDFQIDHSADKYYICIKHCDNLLNIMSQYQSCFSKYLVQEQIVTSGRLCRSSTLRPLLWMPQMLRTWGKH